MKGRMFLSFAAADYCLLSRHRLRVLDGRGDLSLVGSASEFPSHQFPCFASSGVRAAVPPTSAQHQPYLQLFAAPSRSSTAAGHRAFSRSVAAVPLCVAVCLSFSQDRLCSAPPLGGSALLRIGSFSFPAALRSPLSRRRIGARRPVTATFSFLVGGSAVHLAGAKSHRSPSSRSHFSIVLHSQAPNPAVNRTCARSRAGRLLLR